MRAFLRAIAGLFTFAGMLTGAPAFGETVTIGTLRVSGAGPVFIAQEKGYFAAQGLDARVVFTDTPQTMGQAVLSGDLDFSLNAMTAAFYNIAGQGALRIIAGSTKEWPGFQGLALAASNQAYAAGLTSIPRLRGRSLALPSVGTLPQYDLSILAAKYGFDERSVKILQLGSLPNVVSAAVGGGADATMIAFPYLRTAIQAKKLRLLAFVGDEMRTQAALLVTSAKVADDRPGLVGRFLTAYRAGVRDYHDAFTGPGETRRDGPAAAQVYALIAKYLDQPLDLVKLGVGYYDRDARVDAADLLRQIAYYKSHGMVKPAVDGNAIIDRRYAVPMPESEAAAATTR